MDQEEKSMDALILWLCVQKESFVSIKSRVENGCSHVRATKGKKSKEMGFDWKLNEE